MNELIGRIHSVETLGTVDGPGIRFVVFMQGCPLKCKYCHNRDTWEINAGKTYTVDELIKKILRSKSYFEASGGGVTVSGGEPLLQVEFVTELFKKLKELNIHTALDTAGSLPINDKIKWLLKYTDLVLLDIKHIDEEKSIDLVGTSNKNNLKNWAKPERFRLFFLKKIVFFLRYAGAKLPTLPFLIKNLHFWAKNARMDFF